MAPIKNTTAAASSPPASVIEVPSDSPSGSDDDSAADPNESGGGVSSARHAPQENRDVHLRADGQVNDAADDADPLGDSPASKRQKLPVRIKHAESADGHARIELEVQVPVPAPGRYAASSWRKSKTEDRMHVEAEEDQQPTKPAVLSNKKIVLDGDDGGTDYGDDGGDGDDGHEEEFVTPLEAPATNPLDQAVLKQEEKTGSADADKGLSLEQEGREEEDESDDDAPPEAVSAGQAAAQTLKSAKAASKAAQENNAAQKRRRRERDALLKKQAEGRKRAAAVSAAGAAAADPDSSGDDAPPTPAAVGPTPNPRKRPLDLLPPELLESSDSDASEDAEPTMGGAADAHHGSGQRPKKRRLRLEQDAAELRRRYRDRQVGSTIYRVAPPKRDASLAPKVSRAARHAKQGLLVRKRVAKREGGFFAGGKQRRSRAT